MDETRRKELQAIGARQGHGILVNGERYWPQGIERVSWTELLDLLESDGQSERRISELQVTIREQDDTIAVLRNQSKSG